MQDIPYWAILNSTNANVKWNGRILTYWQMILLRNSKMQGLPVVGKISWYKTCHIITLYFSKTIDDQAR